MIKKTSTNSSRYKWEVLALLWVAYLLNQADRQVFNVVLPLIREELLLSDVQVGAIATIFNLAYALLVPVAGFVVRGGKEWAEYIVGEHDLLYFSLRRLEFSDAIKDNTNGVFHVLSLVDGEKVKIHSVNHPEYSYIQNFMDIVIVPANTGEYIIHNLGNQPVCIHKTLLKEGFIND